MSVGNITESTRDAQIPGSDLLTMPKSPVSIWRGKETMIGRFLRCAVNLIVVFLIVLLPLPLGYLLNGLESVNRLLPLVLTLFLLVAIMGSLVALFVILTPAPARSLAGGQYFTRWQLTQEQSQKVRRARRRELWKLYLFAGVPFVLAGIGVGSGSVDRDAVNSRGETIQIVAVVLGFAAMGMTICAFLQWRQRGVNGLGVLKCHDVVIGPGGIYVAGAHTPLELLTRVYQTADAANELQFEFREQNDSIKTISVPYPADQLEMVGQLQSLLNEHDASSLGMIVAELPIAASNGKAELQSSVTYSYKLNASPGRYHLRLTDHSLEVFDEGGTAVRELEFSQIKCLYEYDGINGSDPRSGDYRTEFCRIKSAWWKSLTIRNGSYVGPKGKMGEISINQHPEFEAFVQKLKQHVAVVHPNVPVETGSTIVVLICVVVALLGLFFGCVAFAPAESIDVRIGLVGFALLVGGPMIWLGSRGAISHWPRRRSVTACVRQ